MKRPILTILLAIALIGATAQPSCNVRRFSLRDGLASNVISSMEQTSDQLMWFSSWNGLNCYDGYTFTTFNDRSHHGERTLTTNRMLKITPSATGNIWCLTYDRQVFLFDRSTCRFINYSEKLNQVAGRSFDCQRIAALANGHIWLFSREENGVCFCVDEQKGTIDMYSMDNHGLKGGKVYGVELDDDGREWVCTDGGPTLVGSTLKTTLPYNFVCQVGSQTLLATADGRFGTYQGKDIEPLASIPQTIGRVKALKKQDDRRLLILTDKGLATYDTMNRQTQTLTTGTFDIESVHVDSRQRVWALTAKGDVLLILPSAQPQLLPTTQAPSLLQQSNRYFVHEDRYGTIWIGTAQGFFGYYDEATRSMVSWPIRTSVGHPTIDRWFADSRGDLWFSGEHDVAVINFGQRMFNRTVLDGMQQVRSICYDHKGRLWTGDITGHVAVSDGQKVSYLGKDGQLHPQPSLFSDHIYCLYEDSRQRMWIGTKGDGLFCITADGHISHYLHAADDAWSLPSNQIYDVHEDRRHRIWVGTFEQGICLLEGDRFLHAGNQLKGYPVKDFFKVRRISETPDGVIIVSASNGLVTFSEQFQKPEAIRFYAHKHVPGDTTSLLTSDVMQAFVDRQGRTFVATVGGGLQQTADSQLLNEKLKLTTAGHMDDDYGTILNMLEDQRGNLWIGRESSLSMHEAETGRLWLFGPGHLGEGTELTEAKPAYNPQTGQIAFATTNGYVSFQPEKIGQENYMPPLVFKSVYFHGTQNYVHLKAGSVLDVPASQRNLTIHFAALDYQDNFMIRYAYKLEGVDDDWNSLGTDHSISFSNLPHGHHRLLVRSTNQYGSWAENESVLELNVHPTFGETWWAKLLYLLLAAGIVAVVVWIYQLRTRAEQEQQKSRMLSLLLEEIKTHPQTSAPADDGNAPTEPAKTSPAEDEAPTLQLRPTDIIDSDKQMMEQLLAYIEDNLANPDLKVEDLAQAVNLGRTAFYNKVKALVGISPVELLRHIRIRHAEDMVAKSQEPFSQIAYAVGFNDAHYFGKCFKKQTGLTPSEYRECKA